MKEKIIEIIAGVARKDKQEIAQSMSERRLWDSLLHVELVIALEAEFDVFFSQEEIAYIDTPEKVVEMIQSKVAAREA